MRTARPIGCHVDVIEETAPRELSRAVSTQTAEELGAMMVAVVNEGSGTAAALPGIQVAGKTGTAEFGSSGAAHAWFTGFAPSSDPKVAVAVVVEDGGNAGNEAAGGRVAAPIAKAVMEAVLGK